MKLFRLCFLFPLVFLSALSAQSPAGAPPIKARIVCLSVTGEEIPDLRLMTLRQPIGLRAPTDYFSDPVDYHGPARLVFYSGADAASATPAAPGASAEPPPFATVELPPEGGEFLLLFGGQPGAVRIAAMDFSRESAPLGAYLFWNLSSQPLGVRLGEAAGMLSSGARELIRPQSEDRSYLALRVFGDQDGAARQLFASRHFHRETTRQLVFITDAETPGRVRLKIITQRVLAPLQSVAAATTASRN